MITKPIYTWGDGGRGYRLINRFLANQPFRGLFTQYCRELIDIYYNLSGTFFERVNFLNSELSPYIQQDRWRFTDMGYTFEQFENTPYVGYSTYPGANWAAGGYTEFHTNGIQEFMEVRIQSALQELE